MIDYTTTARDLAISLYNNVDSVIAKEMDGPDTAVLYIDNGNAIAFSIEIQDNTEHVTFTLYGTYDLTDDITTGVFQHTGDEDSIDQLVDTIESYS